MSLVKYSMRYGRPRTVSAAEAAETFPVGSAGGLKVRWVLTEGVFVKRLNSNAVWATPHGLPAEAGRPFRWVALRFEGSRAE